MPEEHSMNIFWKLNNWHHLARQSRRLLKLSAANLAMGPIERWNFKIQGALEHTRPCQVRSSLTKAFPHGKRYWKLYISHFQRVFLNLFAVFAANQHPSASGKWRVWFQFETMDMHYVSMQTRPISDWLHRLFGLATSSTLWYPATRFAAPSQTVDCVTVKWAVHCTRWDNSIWLCLGWRHQMSWVKIVLCLENAWKYVTSLFSYLFCTSLLALGLPTQNCPQLLNLVACEGTPWSRFPLELMMQVFALSLLERSSRTLFKEIHPRSNTLWRISLYRFQAKMYTLAGYMCSPTQRASWGFQQTTLLFGWGPVTWLIIHLEFCNIQ